MPIKVIRTYEPKAAPQEASDQLLEKIRELANLYRELHPDGDYLSIAFYLKHNTICFNNTHWDDANPDYGFKISRNLEPIDPTQPINPED